MHYLKHISRTSFYAFADRSRNVYICLLIPKLFDAPIYRLPEINLPALAPPEALASAP